MYDFDILKAMTVKLYQRICELMRYFQRVTGLNLKLILSKVWLT